ncbi:MAG: DUF2207 domain-containing protein [Candidatus Diapherotrites archaeon]|nr:DUF2207 domain-containing protein [Candidatus Diapherotrites archaeon]
MKSVLKTALLSTLSVALGLAFGYSVKNPISLLRVIQTMEIISPVALIFVPILLLMFIKGLWKYQYELELSEKQTLILIFGLMSLGVVLGALIGNGYLLGSRVYVEPYSLYVDLQPDKAVVIESLVYHVPLGVNGHEFYRSYYKKGPQAEMQVLGIFCPEGFENQINDWDNKIELVCRKKQQYVELRVPEDEKGWAKLTYEVSKAESIKPGAYNITFMYAIPKPYVCYDKLCFFDWNALTDFSLDIKNARVQVSGAKQVWGYPPLDSSFDIPAKTLLEVKATKPRSEVTSYWKQENKPDSEIFAKETSVYIARFFYKYGLIFLLVVLGIVIAGLYLIYNAFGKEHYVPGVPEVLHYPPTKRKPYDVTKIVFGDPNKIEFEGVQATLLDLARRKWLEIKDGVIKFKEGKDELDPYEKKVYETYKWLGSFTGGDLDVPKLKEKIRKSGDTSWLKDIKKKLEDLKKGKNGEVFSIRGKVAALLWLLFLSFLAFLLGSLMPRWLSFGLQSGLWVGIMSLLLIDAYCFGKYKPEIYKEVALWRAFGRLLEDYSLIKKYAPQDVLMWGEWLVYATALGRAGNVIKAMKEFNIEIPNIDYDTYHYTRPVIIYHSASTRYSSLTGSRGGGWSGGGGFGGGFGGGGGGFR